MTIRKLYEAKQIDAKRNGTSWLVDFTELYMDPGYNIRDGEINPEMVNAFCDSFMKGEYVPPIAVDITETGLRVNDGQHRYLGAEKAISLGKEKVSLEVYDVTGLTNAKRIALMVRANDGTPTSNLARASAYARMADEGLNAVEIADEVKRSPSDVRNMLALSRVPAGIKEQVAAGSMSYVTALKLHAEHGDGAEAEAERLQQLADEAGSGKVTPKLVKPKKPEQIDLVGDSDGKFTAAKALRVCELASQIGFVADEARIKKAADDESLTLKMPAGAARELRALMLEYVGYEL